MPVQTLTSQFLATLPTCEPTVGSISYFDTELKGFMLEHRVGGGATYYFRYRDLESKVRMSRIARVGEMTLPDARAKAHAIKLLVSEGATPLQSGTGSKTCPHLPRWCKTGTCRMSRLKSAAGRLMSACCACICCRILAPFA